MQAIITTQYPATNFRPARIKAKCAALSIMISKSILDQDVEKGRFKGDMDYTATCCAHRVAARILCDKLKWKFGTLNTGDLPNGDYVHVLTK